MAVVGIACTSLGLGFASMLFSCGKNYELLFNSHVHMYNTTCTCALYLLCAYNVLYNSITKLLYSFTLRMKVVIVTTAREGEEGGGGERGGARQGSGESELIKSKYIVHVIKLLYAIGE